MSEHFSGFTKPAFDPSSFIHHTCITTVMGALMSIWQRKTCSYFNHGGNVINWSIYPFCFYPFTNTKWTWSIMTSIIHNH